MPYKVVYQPGMGEYEEKKSRFIANVAPVSTEEEAVAYIESVRKKYYDARHNCTAFVIGRNSEITRCSDDGEPGGTAGKPILEVMRKEGVTNAVIVVTRYFGGTLLGTGGLVRAYTQAAQAGLSQAGIGMMRYGVRMTVAAEYGEVGKIQYLLGNEQIETLDSRYAQSVEFDIRLPEERLEEITRKLTELTGARARLTVTGKGYYMDKGETVWTKSGTSR